MQWQPYLIAGIIGLVVGIERERSRPHPKSLGVRTFILVSLLGAVAGGLESRGLVALVCAFTLGLILISYWPKDSPRSHAEDRGLTTEFAAGMIFFVGYLAHATPALAALMGAVVTVVLYSKQKLHRFTRALRPQEFESALLLLLAVIIVINLVPNTPIDPWGIFHPRKFGYLVLTLASLELASYILGKIMGAKRGALVIGFLGGFVSSTAVLLSSARRAELAPRGSRTFLTSALAAQLAAILEVLVIVALVSRDLALGLLFPALAGVLIGAAALAWLSRNPSQKFDPTLPAAGPLDWKGVFRLALTLAAVLGSISLVQLWIGEKGSMVVSFLTALFELHGVSLANATLHSQGRLSLESATVATWLAILASLLAKIGMSWTLTRSSFSRILTVVLLAMGAGIGLVGWILRA